MGFYTTDLEVVRLGCFMMLHTIPFNFLFLPVEVLGGAMRGAGSSLIPTAITLIFVCVYRILWILTVVRRWHSLTVLLACYPISWLLCAVAFFIVYFRGSWLKTVPQP